MVNIVLDNSECFDPLIIPSTIQFEHLVLWLLFVSESLNWLLLFNSNNDLSPKDPGPIKKVYVRICVAVSINHTIQGHERWWKNYILAALRVLFTVLNSQDYPCIVTLFILTCCYTICGQMWLDNRST